MRICEGDVVVVAWRWRRRCGGVVAVVVVLDTVLLSTSQKYIRSEIKKLSLFAVSPNITSDI